MKNVQKVPISYRTDCWNNRLSVLNWLKASLFSVNLKAGVTLRCVNFLLPEGEK